MRELAKSDGLGGLESLTLDYPSPAALKPLGEARWFRNLRSLKVSTNDRDVLRMIAGFPRMPNLVELSLLNSSPPTTAVMRKFAASDSFPQLKRLEFGGVRLTPEHIAILARSSWPLRHLKFFNVGVRKPGAEALADAAFAETLRVLELPTCEITAGGIQTLAASAKFSELKHLDLSGKSGRHERPECNRSQRVASRAAKALACQLQ